MGLSEWDLRVWPLRCRGKGAGAGEISVGSMGRASKAARGSGLAGCGEEQRSPDSLEWGCGSGVTPQQSAGGRGEEGSAIH